MPHFSPRSRDNLRTCDYRLVTLLNEVIRSFDCTIIDGYRGHERQAEAFMSGHSKVRFPNSHHNVNPSLAVDAAPWPIDWRDIERFIYLGGYVKGIAAKQGLPIRWGGDWDGDFALKDNLFNDYAHFEIIEGTSPETTKGDGP